MKLVGPQTAFCTNLAHHLKMDMVEMERRVFPDGEVNPRILEAPREVLLVNTLSSQNFDPNTYILEYVFALKNLRERGTEKMVVVLPYLPYSRQDAVFREGESLTSQYVLELFRDEGVRDLFAVTYHLHRQKMETKGLHLHEVNGVDALADSLTGMRGSLVVAPDEEATKWAQQVADRIGGDVATLTKRRDKTTGEIQTTGDVPEGRDVVIVDDMISTGKTVLRAVEICRKAKSKSVLVCAVHGIFSKQVQWDVEVLTTNTIENPYARVDVTPSIARAIKGMEKKVQK